jgi:hypothetical protein
MKAYGSGCIAPQFLDLGTSWRWVVSFTTLPLYPRCPLDKLGGPQSRLDDAEKRKFLTPPGLGTPTPPSSSPAPPLLTLYSLVFIYKSNIGAGGRSREKISGTSASQVLKSIYVFIMATDMSATRKCLREERRVRWLTRLPVALRRDFTLMKWLSVLRIVTICMMSHFHDSFLLK